jgi:hypothetical protein
MARLYIFLGQSNSRGAAPNADIHPSLAGAMPSVRMFNGTAFADFDVGVNQNYPTPDSFHGTLPAFLYNEQIRTGETIYALNYAVGGTMLNDDGTVNCWYPSRTGSLSNKAISTINAALAAMWNTHGVRTFQVIFIWAQGESDTTADADSDAYSTNMSNLITKFEANLTGTCFTGSTIRWIFQKMSTDTSYDTTRRGVINGVFDSLATANPTRMKAYDTTGATLQVDLHHFEATGYKTIGQNTVTTIMQANNW